MTHAHDDVNRMYFELKELLERVPRDSGIDLAQTHTFLDVGELQLTLDDLASIYMELYKPVPADIVAKIDELGTEMGMRSGYPWPAFRELLGVTGEVDEDA